MLPGAPSPSRILLRLLEIAAAGCDGGGQSFSASPAVVSIPPSITPRECDPGVGGCRPDGGHHPDSDADESEGRRRLPFLPAGDSAIRSPFLPETVGKPFRASARNCPILTEGVIPLDGGARLRPVLPRLSDSAAWRRLMTVPSISKAPQSTTEQRQRCGLRYAYGRA